MNFANLVFMFNNVIKHEDDDEAKPREKVENEDNKNESLKPRKINSWLLALVDDERATRSVFAEKSDRVCRRWSMDSEAAKHEGEKRNTRKEY